MQDKVMMNDKWEFNEEVTRCFDEMLERSIPEYTLMRDLVFKVGKHFVKPNTNIVDIGCSNGNAIEPFLRKFGAINKYKLIDVSEPMLRECKLKYKNWINLNLVDVMNYDLKQGLPDECLKSSLILSILTLQFTPIEYRHKIIQSIYNSLNYGGAFIFVEKVLGNTSAIDEVLVDEYYKLKQDNQYTNEQIANKRKSLEGVLVPITQNWNVELLKSAGFSQVDCFWRCLNFCGFIAIK